MKQLKMFAMAAVGAMALTAVLGAGSASATTLEETGVTKNASVTITASLVPETIAILKDTAGIVKNQCSTSHVHGHTTSPYTGSSVTGDIETLTFTNCIRTVTVDNAGKLEITWTSGTNGTVASEEALVTVGSAIGHLSCTTSSTTNIGTLTGAAAGNAIVDINAVIHCGIVPSAKWEAAYYITSPHGLGVSS